MRNSTQHDSIEHDGELGAKKVSVVGGTIQSVVPENTKNSGVFTFSDTNPKQFSATSVPFLEMHITPVNASGGEETAGTFKWGFSAENCLAPFSSPIRFVGAMAGDFDELWFAATNATDKLVWNSAHAV